MENNDIYTEEEFFFDATPDIPDCATPECTPDHKITGDDDSICDPEAKPGKSQQPKRSTRLSANRKLTPKKAKSSKVAIKNQKETI